VATIGAARYAGSRVHRVEDARLLTGAGTFVDDITRGHGSPA
jgi:carbon-monoxide dehydrogenase large subunit